MFDSTKSSFLKLLKSRLGVAETAENNEWRQTFNYIVMSRNFSFLQSVWYEVSDNLIVLLWFVITCALLSRRKLVPTCKRDT
jgi:hypothetical protein